MKLVEAEIEKIIIEKIREALAGIQNVRVIGAWQPSENPNEEKGEEDETDTAVIAVKAMPRTYSTPTIPDCEIPVMVSLAVRSDVDFDGRNYLWITERLMDIFQEWQNDFTSLFCFNVSNLFDITGFSLNGGDCGIDKENCVWQFSQGFSVYGIVQKNETYHEQRIS